MPSDIEQWADGAAAIIAVFAYRGDDLTIDDVKRFANELLENAPVSVQIGALSRILDASTSRKDNK